jgi:hypothetical protein
MVPKGCRLSTASEKDFETISSAFYYDTKRFITKTKELTTNLGQASSQQHNLLLNSILLFVL